VVAEEVHLVRLGVVVVALLTIQLPGDWLAHLGKEMRGVMVVVVLRITLVEVVVELVLLEIMHTLVTGVLDCKIT
tara:strand:+ start:296 stop:520 length:225 start_codon:yes stop_codon:yes gene_type:complete